MSETYPSGGDVLGEDDVILEDGGEDKEREECKKIIEELTSKENGQKTLDYFKKAGAEDITLVGLENAFAGKTLAELTQVKEEILGDAAAEDPTTGEGEDGDGSGEDGDGSGEDGDESDGEDGDGSDGEDGGESGKPGKKPEAEDSGYEDLESLRSMNFGDWFENEFLPKNKDEWGANNFFSASRAHQQEAIRQYMTIFESDARYEKDRKFMILELTDVRVMNRYIDDLGFDETARVDAREVENKLESMSNEELNELYRDVFYGKKKKAKMAEGGGAEDAEDTEDEESGEGEDEDESSSVNELLEQYSNEKMPATEDQVNEILNNNPNAKHRTPTAQEVLKGIKTWTDMSEDEKRAYFLNDDIDDDKFDDLVNLNLAGILPEYGEARNRDILRKYSKEKMPQSVDDLKNRIRNNSNPVIRRIADDNEKVEALFGCVEYWNGLDERIKKEYLVIKKMITVLSNDDFNKIIELAKVGILPPMLESGE